MDSTNPFLVRMWDFAYGCGSCGWCAGSRSRTRTPPQRGGGTTLTSRCRGGHAFHKMPGRETLQIHYNFGRMVQCTPPIVLPSMGPGQVFVHALQFAPQCVPPRPIQMLVAHYPLLTNQHRPWVHILPCGELPGHVQLHFLGSKILVPGSQLGRTPRH